MGLSWAGFVELSSVGWVPEPGVRGHRSIRHRHLHLTVFSTRNISPNYSVTIDSTPPRPRHPYGAFLCDDLHRAHYGTPSRAEAISCYYGIGTLHHWGNELDM